VVISGTIVSSTVWGWKRSGDKPNDVVSGSLAWDLSVPERMAEVVLKASVRGAVARFADMVLVAVTRTAGKRVKKDIVAVEDGFVVRRFCY
jgi:hypothetical protein